MLILLKILSSVLIFGLIILIHELGHFSAARLCGVKVEEFSFGMGPRLFTIHGKNTDFSLKLFPIGGSCALKGELEDNDPGPDSFISQPPFKRLLVIAAGPFFNFVLAFIAALVLVSSTGSDIPVAAQVVEGMPAAEAGMMPGDKIEGVNGRTVHLFRELRLYNALHPGEPQNIRVDRKGESLNFNVVPVYDEEYDSYLIGIVSGGNVKHGSPGALLKYTFYEVKFYISSTVQSIIYVLSGHASEGDVMGPVGIVSQISDTVETTYSYGLRVLVLVLLDYVLLFSANVGVMNLIPFPALDGGRLIFILIELITGKAVSRKAESYVHVAGFVILLLFMFFIMFKDIIRLL